VRPLYPISRCAAIILSCDIDWLINHGKWLGLSCIGAIHRQFEKGGAKSSEWHFYIPQWLRAALAKALTSVSDVS